jgi:hypothetical protein
VAAILLVLAASFTWSVAAGLRVASMEIPLTRHEIDAQLILDAPPSALRRSSLGIADRRGFSGPHDEPAKPG